jgi:hypothetical protein
MNRLLLITFLFGGINHFSLAQSCKVEVNNLKSKIEADPNSVLYSLGDAITLQPNCISDLIETAIIAAKPNPDILTQIIRLAVSQYPDEAATIAEAAVLASPEEVEVIRLAFQPQLKPIIATPVLENGVSLAEQKATATPAVPKQIEIPANLSSEAHPQPANQSIEFKTSQYDSQNVAEKAMQAIDEMLAKLKQREAKNSKSPQAALSTKVLFGESNQIETFRLNLTDDRVAITTLDDATHHDQIDELMTAPALDPVKIKDSVKPVVNSPNQKVQEKTDHQPAPALIEFSSSVYPIPSSNDLLTEEPLKVAPTVIRGVPMSPTSPQKH